MNAQGAPAGAGGDAPAPAQIRVWDLPTRLFHWLLAASFAGAWLTAEGDSLRQLHLGLGFTAAALIAFRIVWGLIGTRYARFGSLDFRPAAGLRYLRSLLSPAPEHHTGHNPAAAWAIAALLTLLAATALTGWFAAGPGENEALEQLHEAVATLALVMVGVHVIAVALSSLLHRENLARSMLSGMKRGGPGSQPVAARAWVAGLLLVSLAALWTAAPWSGLAAGGQGEQAAQQRDDADD